MTGEFHICRGVNPRYAAMVRARGCRKYRIVGKWTKSKSRAHRVLMNAMLDERWKRGVLLWMADYYDPEPILMVNRTA
jgi:hypothetical protein